MYWQLNLVFIIIILLLYTQSDKKWFGRPIWYQPPRLISPRRSDAQGIEIEGEDGSQQLFDLYSLTHISHGILFYNGLKYASGIKNIKTLLTYTLILEILWEFIENTPQVINKYRKSNEKYRNYPGDSWINSVGDVWMAYFGALIAIYAPVEWQVFIFILLELMLYRIQADNLLTNIYYIFIKTI